MSARRTVAAVTVPAVALVAGLAIGRLTVDATQPPVSPPTSASPRGNPCAGNVPAVAAADAVAALGSRRALDPATSDAVLARWATAGSHDELAARVTVSDSAEQATGLLSDLTAGRAVLTAVAPIAIQVAGCHSGMATARVWTLALLGTQLLGRLDASWSTETLRLSWQRGAWRVAGYVSEAGPAPVVAQPTTPLDVALAATADMIGAVDASAR